MYCLHIRGLISLFEYGILPSVTAGCLCFKPGMQAGIEIAKLFLDEGETVSGNPRIIQICRIPLPHCFVEYL